MKKKKRHIKIQHIHHNSTTSIDNLKPQFGNKWCNGMGKSCYIIRIISMQIRRFKLENKVFDPENLSYSTWVASKFIFRRITWYKLSYLLKYISL